MTLPAVPTQTPAYVAHVAQVERLLVEARDLPPVDRIATIRTVGDWAELARTRGRQLRLDTYAINAAVGLKLRTDAELADAVDEGQAAGEIAVPGDSDIGGANIGDLGLRAWQVAEARSIRLVCQKRPIEAWVEEANRSKRDLQRKRLLRLAREYAATTRRDEATKRSHQLPLGVHVEPVDFRHLDIEPGTVDAIITDPPYGLDALDEVEALGEFAARVLKPGAPLAALFGQAYIPEWVERLGRHLSYRSMGAYMVGGVHSRIYDRKVSVSWKPVLIYSNGASTRWILHDRFRSDGEDKRFHGWGQDVGAFVQIVEALTLPGELVVDPFLGAGTTAVAAHALGRSFVGCDIDAGAVAITAERLA